MGSYRECICEACGAMFHAYAGRTNDGRIHGRFCSRPCASTGHKQDIGGQNHPNYGKRAGEYRVCETCGTRFYAYPSTLRGKQGGRFCSQACYWPHVAEHRRGIRHTAETKAAVSAANKGRVHPHRQKPEPFICEQCGLLVHATGRKAVKVRTSRSRGGRQFCTYQCSVAYVRAHPETTPNWQGGAEPYYGPNWLSQARQARKRDDYTCQGCGLRQTRPALDVHHVRPRRQFHGDHLAANALDNLVTLCKRCHKLAEYGRLPQIIAR